MPDKRNASWKMKKKHWFLLLTLYIIYLLLGAAVFMMMESKREQLSRDDLLKLRIEVNGALKLAISCLLFMRENLQFYRAFPR
jgi:hypothetical protein